MFKRFVLLLTCATALAAGMSTEGCSSVGPGLANHPVDCAIGIKWADCLPGTAGYNNGGGQQTRTLQLQAEQATIKENIGVAESQCKVDLSTPELDPIRQKVELTRNIDDAPPPFAIAADDSFATPVERTAIAKWATIRDACIRRTTALNLIPPSATPQQRAFVEQDSAFYRELGAHVSDLIVALYQQKLTYAEFASKRYEFAQQAAIAERSFRQATLIADEQRQVQAQQLAQQQFQNNLLAWSTYTQAVTARTPQTVRLHCTSQSYGNVVSTNCN